MAIAMFRIPMRPVHPEWHSQGISPWNMFSRFKILVMFQSAADIMIGTVS